LPCTCFVPIYGFNSFGAGSYEVLRSLPNSIAFVTTIGAADDGRVWLLANDEFPSTIFANPQGVVYKSPSSDISTNYAGLFNFTSNNTSVFTSIGGLVNPPPYYSNQISYPFFGLYVTARNVIYDETRRALYMMGLTQNPYLAQDMTIVFGISRNNGLTWSEPIEVSSTQEKNRGQASMALDTITGNLMFGWYDGRDDPTYQSLNYYVSMIDARTLDCIVNKIPVSNPTFEVPSASEFTVMTKEEPSNRMIFRKTRKDR
jgi:hypothetical protein